jgi:thymidylate kinase
MRLVILDGIDNSGKSTLIKRICQECPDVEKLAFPSQKLAASEVFHKVAKNPTFENKEAWYSALLSEEDDAIGSFDDNAIVLIDRMWFSTLIYQGNGSTDKFIEEKKINRRYENMLKGMNVYPEDVFHVILKYPLSLNTNKEENEAKKIFDKNRITLFNKQEALLRDLSTSKPLAWSRYFENLVIFDEPELKIAFERGIQLKDSDLDEIQSFRASQIIDDCIRS